MGACICHVVNMSFALSPDRASNVWSFENEFPPLCDSACDTLRRCSKRVCPCRLKHKQRGRGSWFTWLRCCKLEPSGGFGCDGRDCRSFLSRWLRKQQSHPSCLRCVWGNSMLLGETEKKRDVQRGTNSVSSRWTTGLSKNKFVCFLDFKSCSVALEVIPHRLSAQQAGQAAT